MTDKQVESLIEELLSPQTGEARRCEVEAALSAIPAVAGRVEAAIKRHRREAIERVRLGAMFNEAARWSRFLAEMHESRAAQIEQETTAPVALRKEQAR